MVIDDFLPVYDYGEGQKKFVYLQPSVGNEFWAVLLEKAYAKLYGSYQKIDGGLTSDSMEDFTGRGSEKLRKLSYQFKPSF